MVQPVGGASQADGNTLEGGLRICAYLRHNPVVDVADHLLELLPCCPKAAAQLLFPVLFPRLFLTHGFPVCFPTVAQSVSCS